MLDSNGSEWHRKWHPTSHRRLAATSASPVGNLGIVFSSCTSSLIEFRFTAADRTCIALAAKSECVIVNSERAVPGYDSSISQNESENEDQERPNRAQDRSIPSCESTI